MGMRALAGSHDPMSLSEAADVLLRGLVTKSTLRAAAARGELATERLGRRIVTTPAYIEAWRAKCREQAEGRTFIQSLETTAARRSGISETVKTVSALDAARAILKGLGRPSQPILRGRRRKTSATVIPLASKSPT